MHGTAVDRVVRGSGQCGTCSPFTSPESPGESRGSSKTHGMSAKLSGCCHTLPSQEGAHGDSAGSAHSLTHTLHVKEDGEEATGEAPVQASPQTRQPHRPPPGRGASRDRSPNVTTRPGFLQWTEFKDQGNDSNRTGLRRLELGRSHRAFSMCTSTAGTPWPRRRGDAETPHGGSCEHRRIKPVSSEQDSDIQRSGNGSQQEKRKSFTRGVWLEPALTKRTLTGVEKPFGSGEQLGPSSMPTEAAHI